MNLFVDTERIYTKIYTEILEKFGKKYTDEARYAVTGVNKLDGSRYIVEKFQLPVTIEEYYRLAQEKTSTYLTQPAIKPGKMSYIYYLILVNNIIRSYYTKET